MTKKHKALFIIPARSGSKRLKGKNLKMFNGKPLIFWTIEQCLRLRKYGKTVITSESENILNKCSKYKEINLIKRPKYLSTPNASLIKVIRNVVLKLNYRGIIILLQPTSPLRSDYDVVKCLRILDSGALAVMSQSETQYDLSKLNKNVSGKKYKAFTKKTTNIYAPNGAVFGACYKWIKKNETFYDKSVVTFDMPAERSIDIDYEHQFIAAEALAKKRK